MPELTEEQPMNTRERRLTNQLDTQTPVISDLIKHNHELSAALADLHKTPAASSGGGCALCRHGARAAGYAA